jgi:hypothetical protein
VENDFPGEEYDDFFQGGSMMISHGAEYDDITRRGRTPPWGV